jgi:hypothetical protein
MGSGFRVPDFASGADNTFFWSVNCQRVSKIHFLTVNFEFPMFKLRRYTRHALYLFIERVTTYSVVCGRRSQAAGGVEARL